MYWRVLSSDKRFVELNFGKTSWTNRFKNAILNKLEDLTYINCTILCIHLGDGQLVDAPPSPASSLLGEGRVQQSTAECSRVKQSTAENCSVMQNTAE